ncbi:MAG: TrmB family transcriptional regulator [Brevinema sp.]
MQNEQSILLDRFESLGLIRNEGLVYLALLNYNEPVTGYQLAKDHSILRPIAYEMLNRLVERGGVRMAKGTKDLYSAVPPESFLSLLEKRFHDAKKDLVSSLHTLNQTNRDYYWNIMGFDNIIASAQNLIEKSQKNVLFYLNNPACAKLLAPILSKKAATGVAIQGFSYRNISFDYNWAEIYSYNIPEESNVSIPDDRILLIVDNAISIMGDLDRGYASQSASPSQVETARDFIRSKISIYRLSQIIEPAKLSLYLFEEDRQFLDQIHLNLH